jgi:hypothetical protein
MYQQLVGDERFPLAFGLNVKAMGGIEDRPLAERYRSHLAACKAAIEALLNRTCQELAAHAEKYPEVFRKTNNLPEVTHQVDLSRDREFRPGPIGPASEVEKPNFPDGLTGYRYFTLRHQIALIGSGTYNIHLNGVPTEITLTVD